MALWLHKFVRTIADRHASFTYHRHGILRDRLGDFAGWLIPESFPQLRRDRLVATDRPWTQSICTFVLIFGGSLWRVSRTAKPAKTAPNFL